MAQPVACPRCGEENAPAQRFCGACGAALTRGCPSCGTSNPPGFRFCGSCGAALLEATVTPTEERRWATVLFADLSGFTKLSEPMDPEDVRSLVDRCMSKMGDIVVRYGGFVERVIGDELMALFGAPVAHEDDPERAVRAALELHECASEHADDFGGLALRVGVNTGEMMFAPVGPEGARHFTVMGDAVNTASRLRDAAPRGGVLVGEETYRASQAAIRYEAVAPFHAKGKEQPVPAWLALEPVGSPERRPVSAAPMVGRDGELDLLTKIWDRAVAERRPHLVTILGAPGVGKTRLSRELAGVVEARGGAVIQGRSLPYGESAGYGAFAQQVKQLAAIFETDSAPQAREKLTRSVEDVLPGDATEVAAHLSLLIGMEERSAAADRGPLFFSARRFMEAVASRRPTLFLFEDIHWADQSLLDLLEAFASRTRDVPVIFLTLARPELLDVRPGWGGGLVSYTALPLDPLSDLDAQELAGLLAPHIPERDAIARLAEISGGNPLFVEELAASVSETAAIGSLPTNVKAIIAARLDSLPAAQRQVVLDASVVGKIFWRGALVRLGGDGHVDEILDALEGRDLIRRGAASRIEGDPEFTFKHILIREVAYATLPKAARRERHAEVARFIEEAGGDRIGESAALLAHHWLEAGETGRALTYLVTAADHARRGWASSEAVRLYDEALVHVAPGDAERRRDLLLRRALAITESGELQRAVPELDGLLPELEGRERIEALFARAMAAHWLVDAAGVARFGHELGAEADRLGDDEHRTLSLGVLSLATALDGSLQEAAALGEQAIASWQPGTRKADRSIIMGSLGLTKYWLGDYERARQLVDEAWRLGLEVHSLVGFLQAAPQLGMVLAGLGRHEEAIAHFEWVLARGREIEAVPRWTGRGANMYAGVLYEVFQTERARRLNEEAIELSRKAGFPTATVQAGVDLLFADLRDGEVGRAERAWTRLWEEAKALKGWHQWLVEGRLLEARAELLLASEKPRDAIDAAAEAVAHAQRYPRPKYEAAAHAALAAALEGTGRAKEAVAELRAAVSIAERLGHPPSVWGCCAALSRAMYKAGDDAGAERFARRSRETAESFAATLGEEHRREFLVAPAVAGLPR